MKKFTKFLGLALLAVMTVCMTSCGGDDDLDDINGGTNTENNGGGSNTNTEATYSMEVSLSGDIDQFDEPGYGAFEVLGNKLEDCSLSATSGYTGEWSVINSDENTGATGKLYVNKDAFTDITVTTGPKALDLTYEQNFMPNMDCNGSMSVKVKVMKNGKLVFSKEFIVEKGHFATLIVSAVPMSENGDYSSFSSVK